MARPSQAVEQRSNFLPLLAATFAELGYRRTTTAELARRCEVRENILYRLWADKKAMFIAAIDYVLEVSERAWTRVRQRKGSGSTAQRLIAYEGKHHGEFGYFRIVFAGLSEADDPEIRAALERMYLRFRDVIREEIEAHRTARGKARRGDAELSAWGLIGIATVSNIGRQLGCLGSRQRQGLFEELGGLLLEGRIDLT